MSDKSLQELGQSNAVPNNSLAGTLGLPELLQVSRAVGPHQLPLQDPDDLCCRASP